ncbi:hypothetical protein [Polynucleobacter sp. AP-Latsch-80-C2]|jgi:hypothetical protein|uniref:hypothetical protein n=1 Tax=Polynucleobacter sp. AP-Latsch-80-C2 TaxID=2576931 RepID=UPI001C0B2850|nr:hypothetical protein [Polynucleobacter sp. AP-Latsch-80-C2]MBU3622134.1 hypothetical protein [Polynucleobacter sp. AP-Latsch-80-C2]
MKKIPAIIFVTTSVIALNAFSQPLKERPMLDPVAPQPIPQPLLVQPLLVMQKAVVATVIEQGAKGIEQGSEQEKSIEQGAQQEQIKSIDQNIQQEPIKSIEQGAQPVNGLIPIPKPVVGKQILDPVVPQPVQIGDRQVNGLYAPPPPILDPATSKLSESPRVPQPNLQAPLILQGSGVANGIEQAILPGAAVNGIEQASGQVAIAEQGAEQGAQQAKQAGQQGAQQERQLSSQLRQASGSVAQSMKTQVNTVHVDSAQKGGSPSENLTGRSSSTINSSGFLPLPTTTPGENSSNSLTPSPTMSASSAPALNAGNTVTGATVTGTVNAPSSNSGVSPSSSAGGNPPINMSQPTNNTN